MAVRQLQLAAENGNISAHYALSELYQRGVVPTESTGLDAQGLRLFHLRLAAEGGLPEAQATLAGLYATGGGVRTSPELAMRYYQAASKAGIPEAYYGLGRIHADPSGAHYNPAEAARLWVLAHEQGHDAASAELGWLLYQGIGIPKSVDQAVRLWQEASRAGIARADWGLGQHTLMQDQPDYSVAIDHLRRAVDRGSAGAATVLADLYRTGSGVAASKKTARALYQQASTLSREAARAHFWLGVFALKGQGGHKDLDLARQNLQTAFDFGVAEALAPLVETILQQGEKPTALLKNYAREIDAGDPEALRSLLALAQRYTLNLAEYGLSSQTIQALNTMIAETGDATMQRRLAEAAGAEGDVAEQIRWQRQLADGLDEVAMLRLSELQASRNPEESLRLDQQLAARGNPEGQYRLGQRHRHGDGVALDDEQALVLLRSAARAGHISAAFAAADILARSDTRHGEIMRLYQQASAGGHAEATLRLADQEQDSQKRQTLMLQAIDQGSERAALRYAESRYLDPKITDAELMSVYQKAQSLPLAQLRLVLHNLYFGDAQTAREALVRLELSLQDDDLFIRRIALHHLGQIHTTGYSLIDLAPNRAAARQYLDALAKIAPHEANFQRGNLAAQFDDLNTARKHWQQAGTPESAFMLGRHETDPETRKAILGDVVVNGIAEAWLVLEYPLPMTNPEALRSVRKDQYRRGTAWTVWDYAVDAEHGITWKDVPEAALQWYRVAARLGMPKGFTALGRLLADTDPAAAEALLRKAIAFDQNPARVVLGRILAQRGGAAALEARKLWQKAARNGEHDAELYLAWAYDSGIGGAAEPKKAFGLYRKLFHDGHKQAGFNLANMYLAGRGVKANFDKALEILESAGNQGDTRAWLQLGKILSDSQYQDIYDPEKAAGFLLLAAHSDHAEAWHILGTLYDVQGGLPPNTALAYEYYQKAAYLGWSDAQYRLGVGYQQGHGTLTPDPITAYAWLELASAQGDIAASMVRDSITADFQDGDLDRVKAALKELQRKVTPR